jgi:pseudouridine kinase
MTNNIYCIGGANIDCKLKSTVPLSQQTSNPVNSSISHGGVARNVAENLARWTTGVHLQCMVGNDNEGRQLLAHVRRAGVNIENSMALDNKKTSHYYTILNRDGEVHIALADMEIYHHIPLYPFTHSGKPGPKTALFLLMPICQRLLLNMLLNSRSKRT